MMRNIEIPKDWKVKKLGEISELTAGGTPSTSKPEYWGGNVMWMSSGELNLKKIYDVEGRITELGLKSSSAKIIPEKSILIGLAGQGKTRGTIAMNMVQLCTNQSVAAIMPKNGIIPEYIYHNLDSRYQEIRNLSTGDGGRGGLNLQILRGIKLPIPPKEEQVIISNIIGTWDNSIEILSETVEALNKRKKGLMQQIFSGDLRLQKPSGKSFPDWKAQKLGHYLKVSKAKNLDLKYGDEDVLSVSGEFGIVNQIEFHGRSFAGASVANYGVVETGDIVYTKSPLKANPYGIIKVNKGVPGIVSTLYAIYKCKPTVNGEFVDYYFQLDDNVNRYLRPLVQKGTKNDMKINNEKVLIDKVLFPSVEEQAVIVDFFKTVDQEITETKNYLETLKTQKKGLMQKLLTGEVRVKID